MTIIRAERSLYVWIWAIGGFGTLLSLVKIQNWLNPRSYLVACMVLGFTYAAWRYQVTLETSGDSNCQELRRTKFLDKMWRCCYSTV
jgi:hypothetical protein